MLEELIEKYETVLDFSVTNRGHLTHPTTSHLLLEVIGDLKSLRFKQRVEQLSRKVSEAHSEITKNQKIMSDIQCAHKQKDNGGIEINHSIDEQIRAKVKQMILNRLDSELASVNSYVPHSTTMTKRDEFEAITDEMTDLFMQKNTDYGDSVFETMDEFGMMATVIRLNDKIKRLKTLAGQEAKVKDESTRDTLLDVANYAVTGLIWLDKQEETR